MKGEKTEQEPVQTKRGEEQIPEYLYRAVEAAERAMKEHSAGMMDPAWASAAEAAAHLDSYCKGPRLRNADDHPSCVRCGDRATSMVSGEDMETEWYCEDHAFEVLQEGDDAF